MKFRVFVGLFLVALICFGSFLCATTKNDHSQIIEVDTLSWHFLGELTGDTIILTGKVDLEGKKCILPEGKYLSFRGGIIKNGIIEGNNTKVSYSEMPIFENATIIGSWNVPFITTNMFANLSYENALKDVLALSSDTIHNTIIIEKGLYKLNVEKENDHCLNLNSNTTLIINGVIQLKSNNYGTYDILNVRGGNVKIEGSGLIVGDKDTHTGKTGEWGMGLNFRGAINASVTGITIKNCWGDCIYVGNGSRNITISKCILENGRRQGISVTKAEGVVIRDCRISKVRGTKPEYAIDLEPNEDCTVNNVLIENVVITECEGGIVSTKGTNKIEKRRIGNVIVRNCTVSAMSKFPISMKECENVVVEGCTVYSNNINYPIYTRNSQIVSIINNTVYLKGAYHRNVKVKLDEKNVDKNKVIEIVGALEKNIVNNRIIE